MSRGWYAIGVYHPKTEENVGTLWRSAFNFGAAYCFVIGRRYRKQASDTTKTWQNLPLFEYPDFESFIATRPKSCVLVGVEQSSRSQDITAFYHPLRAIYLLGSEDGGLPDRFQNACNLVIHISTPMCLNVAVAGSIVLYDRISKKSKEVNQ